MGIQGGDRGGGEGADHVERVERGVLVALVQGVGCNLHHAGEQACDVDVEAVVHGGLHQRAGRLHGVDAHGGALRVVHGAGKHVDQIAVHGLQRLEHGLHFEKVEEEHHRHLAVAHSGGGRRVDDELDELVPLLRGNQKLGQCGGDAGVAEVTGEGAAGVGRGCTDAAGPPHLDTAMMTALSASLCKMPRMSCRGGHASVRRPAGRAGAAKAAATRPMPTPSSQPAASSCPCISSGARYALEAGGRKAASPALKAGAGAEVEASRRGTQNSGPRRPASCAPAGQSKPQGSAPSGGPNGGTGAA